MSTIYFLFDENVPLIIPTQLKQAESSIQLYTIGNGTAPAKGTPDADILFWIEVNDCLLVTNNRATMPIHLQEHLSQGHHVPGIVQLQRRMDIRLALEDLLLIYGAGELDEFKDQILYLLLRS